MDMTPARQRVPGQGRRAEIGGRGRLIDVGQSMPSIEVQSYSALVARR